MIPIPKTLTADYVVIGAGAQSMAFVDTILTETARTVIVLDRHDMPGGHWNDAYPFVRLHSPSSFYGVNSRSLGEDIVLSSGLDRGLLERASAGELCGYYDQVMQKQFLPTGRVQYLPQTEYVEANRYRSLITGELRTVHFGRKLVDTTHFATRVPSTHTPEFSIGPGVRCVAPNLLPTFASDYRKFVVVGSGKTGMDSCLWLLERGMEPQSIRWIVPRDSWLMNRAHFQTGDAFATVRMQAVAEQLEIIASAGSVDHLFTLLLDRGHLLRLDDEHWPTMFRCATVSHAEWKMLRQIKDVVRLGHVVRLNREQTVLEHGSIDADPNALYIDCTAAGVSQRAAVPIFAEDKLTLQCIRGCQPCFSAALIAHLEAMPLDEAQRNRLCAPIPSPSRSIDWLRVQRDNLENQRRWSQVPEVRDWIATSRLNVNRTGSASPSVEHRALRERIRASLRPAAQKLDELLAGIPQV